MTTGRSRYVATCPSRPIKPGSSPRGGWPGNARRTKRSRQARERCTSRPTTCSPILTPWLRTPDADVRDAAAFRERLQGPHAPAAGYLPQGGQGRLRAGPDGLGPAVPAGFACQRCESPPERIRDDLGERWPRHLQLRSRTGARPTACHLATHRNSRHLHPATRPITRWQCHRSPKCRHDHRSSSTPSGQSISFPTAPSGGPRPPGASPKNQPCIPSDPGRGWASGVEDLAGPLDDRGFAAPREVDPPVGTLPYVVALDHGPGLLVDHSRAHVFDVVLDERVHELDRPARVGDVVGDE